MPLELSKVHHYVKQPGSMEVKLVQTNPYQRFSREGEPPVYLQRGQFWYENGQRLEDIPSWLSEELRKSNPKTLKECGYELDEGGVQRLDTPDRKAPARRPPVRRHTDGGSNRG